MQGLIIIATTFCLVCLIASQPPPGGQGGQNGGPPPQTGGQGGQSGGPPSQTGGQGGSSQGGQGGGGQNNQQQSCSGVTSTATYTQWTLSTNQTYLTSGSLTNILAVYYTTNDVYIKANSLPSYTIGNGNNQWPNNPNYAAAQNWVFQLTRCPSNNTGTKTATQMGAIGFWTNGVAMYNAKDGYSWQSSSSSVSTSGDGIWNRNAGTNENISFDNCGGHPDVSHCYHSHQNPICLYNSTDSSKHSPIIGWAWDGYPVYGPFGYSNPTDNTSAIKRIMTGYSLRTMSTRTTFWNGTTASESGPAVSSTYYLGYFVEDYGYSSNGADVDQYQGRWCVTPEYPSGTYAYFIPTNSSGGVAFPYAIGFSYFGVVGQTSTSVSVPTSGVTKYFSVSSSY